MQLEELTARIVAGGQITREEAAYLATEPLENLCESARLITEEKSDKIVELCSISNGKCGRCSEDCHFCSQSASFKTEIISSKLKSEEEFFQEAKRMAEKGVHRFSIVTAGVRLSHKEILQCGRALERIKAELPISLCASLGLLTRQDFAYLKSCGLTRIHCNLETSRRFFPKICTTHSFEDKLATLKAAREVGLEICSGCIIGMGETLEDRIDLAFSLREVGAVSVPINILNPIPGTPLEGQPPLAREEVTRCIALFRLILPEVALRLAGGRTLIQDYEQELLSCGINALITGDMLTTCGLSVQSDLQLLGRSSRKPALIPPRFKEI